MCKLHTENGFGATILTAELDSPFWIRARIVRNESDLIEAIVEEKDADDKTKKNKRNKFRHLLF